MLTTHTTPGGDPKVLQRCSYPLTAAGVVDRVYTDLAVLDVTPDGLVVRELVDGLTPDGLQELTGAPLRFADDLQVLLPAAAGQA